MDFADITSPVIELTSRHCLVVKQLTITFSVASCSFSSLSSSLLVLESSTTSTKFVNLIRYRIFRDS